MKIPLLSVIDAVTTFTTMMLSTIISSDLYGESTFAVTVFDDLEDFYEELNHMQSDFEPPENETPEFRASICEAVLRSPYFFYAHKVHYFHPDDQAVLDKDESFLKNCNVQVDKPRHYEIHTIHTHDGSKTAEELVFLCPALNRPPKLVVKKYYISREYHVRNVTTRFVTTYNYQDKMIVIAAAETPASIFSMDDRGRDQRIHFKSKENGLVICNLTTSERIRLCTLVSSAKEYYEYYRFPAKEDVNGIPPCEKHELFLLLRHNWQNKLTRWAIECKVVQMGSAIPASLYISRICERNTSTFFISKKLADVTTVVNYCNVPQYMLT